MTFLGDWIGEGQSKLMVFMNAFDSVTLLTKKMRLRCGPPTNFFCNLELCNRPGKCTSLGDSAGKHLSIGWTLSSAGNLSSAPQSDLFRIRLVYVHWDNT